MSKSQPANRRKPCTFSSIMNVFRVVAAARFRTAVAALSVSMGLLFAIGAAAQASPVDRIEYFLGEDPGFGNGTEVLIEGESGVSVAIPSGSLPPGNHRVHFRARNAEGEWGLTSSIAVRVTHPDEDIPPYPSRVEYFLAEDPGLGEGREVEVEPDSEPLALPVTVPELAGLPPGIHRVHFRTMDLFGRWGLTSSIAVRVTEPLDSFPIESFQYQIADSEGVVRDSGAVAEVADEDGEASLRLRPSRNLIYLEQHQLTVFARDLLGFVSVESPQTPLVVMPPDEEWVRQHFSQEEIESGEASFRHDSDGNGISNGEEYAALTDPRDPDSAPARWISIEDGFLHLHYEQRSGGSGTPGIDYSVAGVSITVDSSIDWLDAWGNGEDFVTFAGRTSTDRQGVERVTVRRNEPISEQTMGFLRLMHHGAQASTSTPVARSVLWVSSNGPPGSSGPAAGTFDDAFVTMLQAQGYSVDRFNPPTARTTLLTSEEVERINGYDLVIVGRATASEAFRSPQGAQWNTEVTAPLMCMSPYMTRELDGWMGWFSGDTLVDGSSMRLTAVNLVDAVTAYIFGSVEMDGSTTLHAFDEPVDRNTSVPADPPVVGIVRARAVVDGQPVNVIADFPPGVVVRNGQDALAGYRMFFAGGSRELFGASISNAGKENLTPTGEALFLRAVRVALNHGRLPR
jgi:hypothetical protein